MSTNHPPAVTVCFKGANSAAKPRLIFLINRMTMTTPHSNPSAKPFVKGKRGVVGVMIRGDKMLTIRRSQNVTAPGKLCLPGGTIEFGETEEQALVREMQEELNIDVIPVNCCWRSVTPWGTKLAFWYADLADDAVPVPDIQEVAEAHWMDRHEIDHASDVLPSLPRFIDAWRGGEVSLPIAYR